MATMPRRPPVRITQNLGDIATATRIESIEKARLTSSTLTTVPQSGESPSHGVRRLGRSAPLVRIPAGKEVVLRQVHQIEPTEELDPADLDQIRRERGRDDAEGEGADQPIAQRFVLIWPRQPEDHDRQDERVVGAQQALDHNEKRNGNEIRELDVHLALRPLTRCVSMPMFDGPSRGSLARVGSAGWVRHGRQHMAVEHHIYFISMAAKLLDMHPQTLRKYERLGLMRPTRTVGSMRVYSREELDRLRDQAARRRGRRQPGWRQAIAGDRRVRAASPAADGGRRESPRDPETPRAGSRTNRTGGGNLTKIDSRLKAQGSSRCCYRSGLSLEP